MTPVRTQAGQARRQVRASTAYIELDFDLDIEVEEPRPALGPVIAPDPVGSEPQSVKTAIIRWLEGRC